MAITKKMLEWALENMAKVTGIATAPSYTEANVQAVQSDVNGLFNGGPIDDDRTLVGFISFLNGKGGLPDLPNFTCTQVETAWNAITPAPAPIPTIGGRGTPRRSWWAGRKVPKGAYKWVLIPAFMLAIVFIGYEVYKKRIASTSDKAPAATETATPTETAATTAQPKITAQPRTTPEPVTAKTKTKGPPTLACENTFGVMRCKSKCTTSFSGDSPPHLLASCGGKQFRSPKPMVQYARGPVKVAMKEVQ